MDTNQNDNEVENDFVTVFEQIQNEYGVDEWHYFFSDSNWENARNALVQVIMATDSDIRDSIFESCFPEGEDDIFSRGESGFEGRSLSPFARQLMCARYSIGWLGNLMQSESIEPPAVQALAFIYAAYWRLGNNFMLGNIVENVLHAVKNPDDVDTSELENTPSNTLGFEIWREMVKVFRQHYIHLGSLARHAIKDGKKPEFREDFRERVVALLDQFEAA